MSKSYRRRTRRRKTMRKKTMRRKTMRRKTMRRRSKQYKRTRGGSPSISVSFAPLTEDDRLWIDDSERNQCAKCQIRFIAVMGHGAGLGAGKHHCRVCGDIFHWWCLKNVEWIQPSSTILSLGKTEPVDHGKQKICQTCSVNPSQRRGMIEAYR